MLSQALAVPCVLRGRKGDRWLGNYACCGPRISVWTFEDVLCFGCLRVVNNSSLSVAIGPHLSMTLMCQSCSRTVVSVGQCEHRAICTWTCTVHNMNGILELRDGLRGGACRSRGACRMAPVITSSNSRPVLESGESNHRSDWFTASNSRHYFFLNLCRSIPWQLQI